MKLLMTMGAVVTAFAVSVTAQDSTVKSRTEIKADDAKAVVMKGCLTGSAASGYSLKGTIASGDEISQTTRVRTDADKDEVSVKAETRTKVEDGAVGTTGSISTYALVPKVGVDLQTHVNKSVEVAAVKVDAGRGDAEVTVREKTTVDPDNGRDASARTETKVELPRSAAGSYTVMSVKEVPGGC